MTRHDSGCILNIMKNFVTSLLLLCAMLSHAGEVFFVPGWRTGNSSRVGCVRIINDIWPGMPVTVKSWDSLVTLEEAKQNAATYTGTLLKEILDMPAERRRELILAGHSLGAVIVLEILDELAGRKMQIKEAALLGAPVPNNDPVIFRALDAVQKYCYNVAFTGDGVLRLLCPLSGTAEPLGVNGWKFSHPRFVESVVTLPFSLYNHFAYRYLEELDRLTDTHEAKQIRIPGGCEPYFYDENGIFWRKQEEFASWQLQSHIINGKFRIVDPQNQVRLEGTESTARSGFEHLKNHLSAGKK